MTRKVGDKVVRKIRTHPDTLSAVAVRSTPLHSHEGRNEDVMRNAVAPAAAWYSNRDGIFTHETMF